MRAKLNGIEVNVLRLNGVEAYAVTGCLLGAVSVEEGELPASGEAYVLQVEDDDIQGSYAEFLEMFGDAGEQSFPSLEELQRGVGLVFGKVTYHLDHDDDGGLIAVFDEVAQLPACLALTDKDELVESPDDQEESIEEMRQHWHDFILPIPPPPKKASDELYLTLAYEFYDAIKAGTKRTEYRDYSPNWVKKILSHQVRTVKFQRGYGGPGHAVPEQMVWSVDRISLYETETGTRGDPCNPPEGILPDAIAIDLGERIA